MRAPRAVRAVRLPHHPIRTFCHSDTHVRKSTSEGNEFIDRVTEPGRRRNVPVRVDAKRGKGSHVILYYGDRKTVVKDRRKDIGPDLLAAMARQLGLDPGDLG